MVVSTRLIGLVYVSKIATLMFLLFFFSHFLQKATRKTDKPRAEEVEVTDLTDEDLKQQLAKHGVDVGPIVGEFPGFIHSCPTHAK